MSSYFLKLNFLLSIFPFINILLATTFALDPYADDWGVTQINGRKLIYSWTISNFSLNDKPYRESITSPTFSNNNDDTRWYLKLFPEGWNDKEYVALYLFIDGALGIKIQYSFAIVDGYGQKVNAISRNYLFKADKACGTDEMVLKDDLKNKVKNLLPDDRLTILVEIIINNGTSAISGRCTIPTEDSDIEQRQTLFEDNLFTDVELLADARVFKVHRGVLAAHSSWFLEKFKAYPNRTVFTIDNISGKALKEVLRFIYTGKVQNLESIAKELLNASNWLRIDRLKLASERELCKKISPKNAMDILMLADLYDAEDLKQQASNYIAAHATSVVDTPEFKNLQESNPHPLFEIFRSLVHRSKA